MFRGRINSTFGVSDTPDVRFQGRFILENPCIEFVPEFTPTLKSPDVFPAARIRSDRPSNTGFSWSLDLPNSSSAGFGPTLKCPTS
jgi:hypothetical protein